MPEQIKVVVVPPNKKPFVKVIGTTTRSFQDTIEGYFDTMPLYTKDSTRTEFVLVTNKEAKLYNKCNPNRMNFENDIYGTFFVTKAPYDIFASLTDKEVEQALAYIEDMTVIVKFEILQAKRETSYKFRSFDEIKTEFSLDDYSSIYKGVVAHDLDNLSKTLEFLFTVFNTKQPEGFHGHSLSVSDIIILNDEDYYYCNAYGFIKIEV